MFNSSIDDVMATLVVALLYVLAVRLIDVNEREPLWSVLLVFVVGGAAAGALNLGVSPIILNLDPWQGAVLRELALCAGLFVAFQVFSALRRVRGWSEVSDVFDGLIYGIAGGLGFTCGEVIANLGPSLSTEVVVASPVVGTASTALAGLAQGVFGAILGAGFARATTGGSRRSWAWVLLGLVVAIVAHGVHQQLAVGNALGGPSGLFRARVALALPLLIVVALGAHGLARQRRAILEELSGESDVTESDLRLLGSFGRRQIVYLRAIASARLRDAQTRAALHNRQVMLALAKRRVAQLPPSGRQAVMGEVDALRRSIPELRRQLGDSPHDHLTPRRT